MLAPSAPPRGCAIPRRDCALQPRHGWGGWPQWRLHFAWFPAPPAHCAPPAGAVTLLHIEGLRPSDLQWIEIRRNDRVLYAMDSCEGRTGHVATAGDLVHAMARLSGLPGLAIDARHLGQPLALPELSLQLQVRAAQQDELDRIQVQALLECTRAQGRT